MKIIIKILFSFSVLLFQESLGHRLEVDQVNGNAEVKQGTQNFPLRSIYNALFDLYFPNSSQLSTGERRKRLEWREELWEYTKNKPEILHMLNLLQPTSPLLTPDLKEAFRDIFNKDISQVSLDRLQQVQYILRRHNNNNVRMFAGTVRKLFSYLIYSTPLTWKIAGSCTTTSNSKVIIPMTIYPPSKLKYENNKISHMHSKIDYLIIGSGPAGSVIAHELALRKKDCHVVLLDQGSFVMPQTVNTESSSELMESNNLRTNTSGGIIIRNGRAIGGGTTVNLDLAFSPLLPQVQERIQDWAKMGYMPCEFVEQQKLEEAYNWICQKVGTRQVEQAEVNENNGILLHAMPTATTYNLNARRPTDVHGVPLKISSVEAFIMPALCQAPKALSIIPDVKVQRLIFDQSTNYICGAEIIFQESLDKPYILKDPNSFNATVGQTAIIKAENIILCAGALGSAEILLKSNVHNDNIGKGIVLHPSIGIYGRFNKEIDVNKGLLASVYAPALNNKDGYFFEAMSADPAFIALLNPGSGSQIIDIMRDVKYLGGFGIMLVDSVSPCNKVFIDASGKAQVDYTLSFEDKIRLKRALAQGLDLLFDQGAYEVYLPSSEPLLSDNGEYKPFTSKEDVKIALDRLNFIENENFISSAHMQGSNKIGPDPLTCVVSHNFKVWNKMDKKEYENLYVCDSSIFPTSVGANPMQSIYTFAKLFVDTLIGK